MAEAVSYTRDTWEGGENFNPRWPDFYFSEFVCRCGCGECRMDPEFLDMLQLIRGSINLSINITSGYRCENHPEEVNKEDGPGAHNYGRAADMGCPGWKAIAILAAATILSAQGHERPITGIGVQQKGKKRFLHLDSMKPGEFHRHRPTMWSY